MRGLYSRKSILEIQEQVQKGTITLNEGIQEIVSAVEHSPAYLGSPSTFEEPLRDLRGALTVVDFESAMSLLFGRLVAHFTGKSLPSITEKV